MFYCQWEFVFSVVLVFLFTFDQYISDLYCNGELVFSIVIVLPSVDICSDNWLLFVLGWLWDDPWWCKYIVVIRYLVTLQYAISRICYVHWYPSLFSLFVCGFSSNLRIFHTYGDVTITGEGLQILTYARHLWPLSREGSLACHNYCDKSHLFLMVIFEDPWHSHRLNSVWQKSCHCLI